MEFFAVDIGKINIVSGRIIACDPIVMNAATPYTQLFPTGQFPVQLAIAHFYTQERVAYSRIFFSQAPVAKWEFALRNGQKKMPVGGESIYGFGVDAGIGIYIDSVANLAYNRVNKKEQDLWDKILLRGLRNHDHGGWQYTLSSFGRHNLACFTTGMGDGSYGVYIGYDTQGKVCRLLTDFALVPWWAH